MSQTLEIEKERGWEREKKTTLRKIVGEIKKDGMTREWQEAEREGE